MKPTYYKSNPEIWQFRCDIKMDMAFNYDAGKTTILKELFNKEWKQFCDILFTEGAELPEYEQIMSLFSKCLKTLPLLFTEKGQQYQVNMNDTKGYMLNFLECELLWRASCMDNTRYVCKGDERIYFKNINEIITV